MNPHEIRQIGEYRVRRFIAEGGMAWVFEVEVPGFKQATLALKMLKPAIGGGDLFRRFQEEAERLLVLDHPNLMRLHVFGLDEATGCHFYTMPLIDTPPLSERGPIPIDEAIGIFLDALAGLAKLHDSNIIHRDIKPSNILMHPDGRAIVTDLGIARSTDLSEGETWYEGRGATMTGVAIGTPAYMSPEQARGRRSIDKSTDVFSFGLTMYRLLTGQTVYHHVEDIDSRSGQEILAYLSHLSFGDEEFDLVFPAGVPEPVRAIIRKACRMNPTERYPDAAAMRADLMSTVGLGATPPTPTRVPARRPRWLMPTVAAIGLLVLVGVVWRYLHRAPAGTTFSAVQALAARSGALMEAAQAQGAPADVLADANKEHSDAAALLQSARDATKGSDAEAASLYLRGAARGFEKVCETLVARYSAPALESDVQALEHRAAALGPVGKALQADRWKSFEKGLRALETPARLPSSCDTADAVQAQRTSLQKLSDGLPALQEAIEAAGQSIVASARDQALAAQKSAEQPEIDAPPFKTALDEANQLLGKAQSIDAGSKPLAARDAFDAAAKAFATAGTVAQAAESRERASKLRSETAALIQKDTALGDQITKADTLYAQRNWQAAIGAYDDVSTRLESALRVDKEAEPARQARALAETARDQARASGAETAAADAFTAAGKQLAAGAKALTDKHFDEARKAYQGAAAAFAEAGRKAAGALDRARTAGRDAKAARDALGKDCASLPSAGRAPCTRASDALARGDAALGHNDASAALESYATARQAADAARAAKDSAASLAALRVQTKHARDAALSSGAEKSAPTQLAAADKQFAAAESAASSGRDGEAKAAYADAQAKFAQAGHAASAALDDARSAGRTAKSARAALGSDCAQLPGVARSDCRAASAALSHGRAALAAKDAPTAAAGFAEALERVHSAEGARKAWDANHPRPPEIVSRSPRSDHVTAHRGEQLTFQVATRDAKRGAALHYEWSIDGRKRPERGPLLELHAERTETVKLRVEDAGGLSASAHWQVHLENRKPTLTVSPNGSRLDVALGNSLAFDAHATDPDGDPVRVSYLLDGRTVASGTHFAFRPRRAGSYRLDVRAEDAGGAVAELERHIEVSGGSATSLTIAESTLRRYEAAYKAQKIERLATVWEMSNEQRNSMESFFKSVKNLSISVKLEPKSVHDHGGQISAVFHQEVKADGIQPSNAELRATLVKHGSAWRIQKIGPR